MARFNRINLDGKSITETRTASADTMAGTAMAIDGDDFVAPDGGAAQQQIYVANTGHLQGLSADDAIPTGDSVEGEYLETGRGIAVLVAAGVAVTKDAPLAVNADGLFVLATTGEGATRIVAYAQEDYTTTDEPELVWARGA